MSTPTAFGFMEETGRKFRRNWSAQWDATNVSDFVAEKILNIDDIGTDYSSARYAIEHVEWSSNATIGASIYFDGIADGGDVLEITDGATAGEVDFKNFPSGVAQDSDNTGNNLVIDTINAANGDKITLTIIGRVKGKRQP